MTELAAYTEPGTLEPHTPAQATHGGLAALAGWVDVARQVFPLADTLSKTSFVPKALQGKPYEVMAAILAGSEVGMQPMAALRSVDIIEGKPSFNAISLRGLVQSHGHAIWTVESTDTRAVVRGRRRDSDKIEQAMWTMDMAKKAGLAGKTNWQRHPAAMLVARATGEVARRVAADVIAGMPYSSEELADGVGLDEPPTADVDSDVPPAGVRRMSRRKPEPAPDPEPDPEPEAAEAEQGISPQQMKALQAGFKAIGVTDRDERLRRASRLAGREIGSANDLTHAEASRVLDYLNDPGHQDEDADQEALSIFDSAGHEPDPETA